MPHQPESGFFNFVSGRILKIFDWLVRMFPWGLRRVIIGLWWGRSFPRWPQDLSSSFAGMSLDPPPTAPTHHQQSAEPARPARKNDPPARPPPPNVPAAGATGESAPAASTQPAPNPYAGAPGPLPYPVQAAMPMPFAPFTPMPGDFIGFVIREGI
jgi:hypothetical protein